MKLAVIPARGGSKRIPRKNIKHFGGKPMIAHAIAAAQASALFTHILVSTDDEEVAHIARTYGAETPFMRPSNLADDHTPTVPVIAHAIREVTTFGWVVDCVCCIYPCNPFLRPQDLEQALALLHSSHADYVFTITEFPSAPQRALTRHADGRLAALYPAHELARTQDLAPSYHDAGQFYWGTRHAWLNNPRIHSNGMGLVIPRWRVIDIDTPEDWQRAEMLYPIVAKSI
ncbi:MAG TPA: pseudaminic acid cytidylyltransferase [Burkholderiaceae bacterium]|nr:pseudaminic acid cytidylyltransferase [Burkholderiaceae bacterium]